MPEAKALLVSTVKSMSVEDARKIVTGSDDSVTRFFAEKTREPLGVKFLPIVTRATEKVSLASKYNAVAGKVAGFGLVKKEDANIEQYVTGKALDGLYLMIGEEERKIRQNPVATGSAILKTVFGSLRSRRAGRLRGPWRARTSAPRAASCRSRRARRVRRSSR